MSYYLGTLHVECGAYRYEYFVRFEARNERDAEQRLHSIAATIFSSCVTPAGENRYQARHNGAIVFVSPGTKKQVSRQTFDDLASMITVQ